MCSLWKGLGARRRLESFNEQTETHDIHRSVQWIIGEEICADIGEISCSPRSHFNHSHTLMAIARGMHNSKYILRSL